MKTIEENKQKWQEKGFDTLNPMFVFPDSDDDMLLVKKDEDGVWPCLWVKNDFSIRIPVYSKIIINDKKNGLIVVFDDMLFGDKEYGLIDELTGKVVILPIHKEKPIFFENYILFGKFGTKYDYHGKRIGCNPGCECRECRITKTHDNIDYNDDEDD